MESVYRMAKSWVPAWLHPRNTLGPSVIRRTEGRIYAGPFRGMHYPALDYLTESKTSAFFPKLLGTYERELAESVEGLISADPDVVVNVGAGEGYYAVGTALRCPKARVVAFEADPAAHAVCADMAERNRVRAALDIRGRCSPGDLADALVPAVRPAVICDVEGYEDVLLDPVAVPALSAASILVETHEIAVPGITERLKARFASTHAITHILEVDRTKADYPFPTLLTRVLPSYYVTFLVREHRFERMNWLWMRPRGGAAGAAREQPAPARG
jgi:hypothetical protein